MSLSRVGQQSSPNSGALERHQMLVSQTLVGQPSFQPFLGVEGWNHNVLMWPLQSVTDKWHQLKSRCFAFTSPKVRILVPFCCWDPQEI